MTPTPFEQVGGQPVVDRIIDSFYDRMDTLAEAKVIRALHPQDLGPTREVLKRYLAEWLGGPRQPIEHQQMTACHGAIMTLNQQGCIVTGATVTSLPPVSLAAILRRATRAPT